ncbi:MAG TPA: hypothetical protein VKR23_14180 [Gaiellaceae bacterium]|nr:hypothetical protein [Gaiellaceae bacterium]
MALADDLERVATAAAREGDRVTGVLPTDLLGGERVYLCSYESGAWVALDDAGVAVTSARLVHDAVSISALCEVAEETAGGGDLDALRARLAELRETEHPEGIEEAEEAAAALAATLRPQPRVASTNYLDALGTASRRLEQALGDEGGSPFAVALQNALPAVEELAAEVAARSTVPLT